MPQLTSLQRRASTRVPVVSLPVVSRARAVAALLAASASVLPGCDAGEVDTSAAAPASAVAAPLAPRPPLPAEAACAQCPRALGPLQPDEPARQRLEVRGSTLGAASAAAPAGCAGLGPELAYELDLRAFAEPAPLALGLRASFDGSLRIERGAPADPALVACNTDHVSGVPDAFLRVTLEPELYRVIVDGETEVAAGEFELWLELLPRAGRCRAAPDNDRCERPRHLDPAAPRQVLVGTTECASDQAQPAWECGNFEERRGEVFYGLDLSARSEPVLLHASTDLEPAGADVLLYVLRDAGGECAETLLCNNQELGAERPAELWARLPPDRYLLAVESRSARASDFGLLVELGGACDASNDTCQTAQPIEPVLGTQRFTAWPMCGDDSLSSSCQRVAPTPDVFYRLDLGGFRAPVRVQATTALAGRPLQSLLLLGERAGTCAGELWCGDFDLWLPPAVYYLALDAFRDQQGPVELSVTLSTADPPAPAACIDARVAECARPLDCCAGDGDGCWLALQSCGLEAAALACLCAADPACCGPGSSYECGALLADCGAFCPGFDPAVACP